MSRSTVAILGLAVCFCAIFRTVETGTPDPLATSGQRPFICCSRPRRASIVVSSIPETYTPYLDSMQPPYGLLAGIPFRSMPYEPRAVLAKNLAALRKAHPDLSGQRKLAKKAGIGEGSVWRAAKGGVGVSIDTLRALARAFGLQPWQLLVPGLDPNNPPLIQAMTEDERRLYALLKQAAKQPVK